ncbi:hypothetical protein HMI54_001212 [Coelomomyces lativittatus]|nr:hypothetical protein HMI55_001237 [Coelomomyces lativittatus]KAJ1518354.1 hypothetical protein HMI54_001212 [Coelomomyces lativittatus]
MNTITSNVVDELDMTSKFEFKRISDGFRATEPFPSDLIHSVHLLTVTNQHGLACWLSSKRNELILASLVNLQTTLIQKQEKIEKVKKISLPITDILFLYFMSNEAYLLVASSTEILLLDVFQLVSEIVHVHSSFSFSHAAMDSICIHPDPKKFTLAILNSEKELFTLDLVDKSLKKLSTSILTMGWSFDGDQLITMTKEEILFLNVLDGSVQETFKYPNVDELSNHHAVAIFSINDNTLLLAFSSENEITISILNKKTSTLIISSSILYPILDDQKDVRVYFQRLQGCTHKLIGFVASSTSSDILVFGGDPPQLMPWYLDETARIIIPSSDMKDAIPLGIGLDVTSQFPLPPLKPDVDPSSIPPVPIIYAFNDRGVLTGWHCLDIDAITKKQLYSTMFRPTELTAPSIFPSTSSSDRSPTPVPPMSDLKMKSTLSTLVLKPSSLSPPTSPTLPSSPSSVNSPTSSTSSTTSPSIQSSSPSSVSPELPPSKPAPGTLFLPNESETEAPFITPLQNITTLVSKSFGSLRNNISALDTEIMEHLSSINDVGKLKKDLNTMAVNVATWQGQLNSDLQVAITLKNQMGRVQSKLQHLKELTTQIKEGKMDQSQQKNLGLGPEQENSQERLLASKTKVAGLLKKLEFMLFRDTSRSDHEDFDSIYQFFKSMDAAIGTRRLAVDQLITLFNDLKIKTFVPPMPELESPVSPTPRPQTPSLSSPKVRFSNPSMYLELKNKYLLKDITSLTLIKAKNPTWKCTSCHTRNLLLSTSCAKCSLLHPLTNELRATLEPAPLSPAVHTPPPAITKNVTSLSEIKKDELWTCTHCQALSSTSLKACKQCGKSNLATSLLQSSFLPKPSTTLNNVTSKVSKSTTLSTFQLQASVSSSTSMPSPSSNKFTLGIGHSSFTAPGPGIPQSKPPTSGVSLFTTPSNSEKKTPTFSFPSAPITPSTLKNSIFGLPNSNDTANVKVSINKTETKTAFSLPTSMVTTKVAPKIETSTTSNFTTSTTSGKSFTFGAPKVDDQKILPPKDKENPTSFTTTLSDTPKPLASFEVTSKKAAQTPIDEKKGTEHVTTDSKNPSTPSLPAPTLTPTPTPKPTLAPASSSGFTLNFGSALPPKSETLLSKNPTTVTPPSILKETSSNTLSTATTGESNLVNSFTGFGFGSSTNTIPNSTFPTAPATSAPVLPTQPIPLSSSTSTINPSGFLSTMPVTSTPSTPGFGTGGFTFPSSTPFSATPTPTQPAFYAPPTFGTTTPSLPLSTNPVSSFAPPSSASVPTFGQPSSLPTHSFATFGPSSTTQHTAFGKTSGFGSSSALPTQISSGGSFSGVAVPTTTTSSFSSLATTVTPSTSVFGTPFTTASTKPMFSDPSFSQFRS